MNGKRSRKYPELVRLVETIKALHGFSGAHVREFARFAGIIREQDGLDAGAAARAAILKLQEQRDLITSVQSQGSRYRAPSHVTAGIPAASDDLLTLATVATAAMPAEPALTETSNVHG